MTSRITQRLERAGSWSFSVWCIVAAFSTYFCMYAFRKPFTAGTFEGEMRAGPEATCPCRGRGTRICAGDRAAGRKFLLLPPQTSSPDNTPEGSVRRCVGG